MHSLREVRSERRQCVSSNRGNMTRKDISAVNMSRLQNHQSDSSIERLRTPTVWHHPNDSQCQSDQSSLFDGVYRVRTLLVPSS